MLQNVVLPLISLLAGLISLYVDPKKDKAKAWMVIAVLVASAVTTGISGTFDSTENKKKDQWSSNQIVELTAIGKNLSEQVGKVQASLSDILKRLGQWGDSNTDIQRLSQSVAADAARTQALPQVTKSTVSTKPTIQYYPKDVDGDLVKRALQEGGFSFRTGTPALTLPTSSIWVGDSVTVEEAKFVAYTLIRAGVQIRALKRFRNGSGSKSRLIEVGADVRVQNSPVLTVDDIDRLQDLPRDTN